MWFEPKINFLHITDMHFLSSHDPSRKNVLDAMIKDIEKIGMPIDFIAVTGDIAFSGKNHEYIAAKEFFKQQLLPLTKLDWSSVYMVPGNHDIERSKVNPSIFKEILATEMIGEYNEQLHFLWNHEPSQQFIQQKFTEYKHFSERTIPSQLAEKKCLSWSSLISKEGFHLELLGVNSAWAAGYDGEERQNLIVGRLQLEELLKESDNKLLPHARLLLIHHPTECLHPIDQKVVRMWVNEKIDFVLSGHTHETALENYMYAHTHAAWITGGATYINRRYTHSYSMTELGPTMIQIHLRRYGPTTYFYGADTLSYPDASENGILTWQWRRRPRIYIAGSIRNLDLSRDNKKITQKIIQKLTNSFLNSGIRVWATSRVPFIGAQVWAEGWKWCYEKGVDPGLVLSDAGLYPVATEFAPSVKDFISARKSYISIQDAIIAVGGSEGTTQELEAARECNIPVIAARWAGGSAAEYAKKWGDFPKKWILNTEDAILNDPNLWADQVVSLISKNLWADRLALKREKGYR